MFIGGGDKYQSVVDYQTANQLDNIAAYPYQKESDLPYTMTLATISLVALDGGSQELMIPSKVYYYMAAGSAVIGICSGESELNDIINSCNCGFCMEPGNPKNLADKIERLLQNPKELDVHRYNSRKFIIDSCGKEIGIKRFVSLLIGDL